MNLENFILLAQIQQAIGEALTKDQQLFISANYGQLVAYLHSDAGKAACRAFVEEWQTAPTK